MSVSAIIVAGGSGTRMGALKQFLALGDKLVIQHSFDLFAAHPLIDEIVVVVEPSHHDLFPPSTVFADPGARRQDSVSSGFHASSGEWILVHDAARPFVTHEEITAVIEAAKEVGAAALATRVVGTIRQAEKDLVTSLLDRSTTWEMQTPQVLSRELFVEGMQKAGDATTLTDDVALAELVGADVKLVLGSRKNFKLTTPEDLQIARALYGTL